MVFDHLNALCYAGFQALHVRVVQAEVRDGSISIEEAIPIRNLGSRDVAISLNHIIRFHFGHDNVQERLLRGAVTVQAEVVHPDFELDAILRTMLLGYRFVGVDSSIESVRQILGRGRSTRTEPVSRDPADLASKWGACIQEIVLPLNVPILRKSARRTNLDTILGGIRLQHCHEG